MFSKENRKKIMQFLKDIDEIERLQFDEYLSDKRIAELIDNEGEYIDEGLSSEELVTLFDILLAEKIEIGGKEHSLTPSVDMKKNVKMFGLKQDPFQYFVIGERTDFRKRFNRNFFWTAHHLIWSMAEAQELFGSPHFKKISKLRSPDMTPRKASRMKFHARCSWRRF